MKFGSILKGIRDGFVYYGTALNPDHLAHGREPDSVETIKDEAVSQNGARCLTADADGSDRDDCSRDRVANYSGHLYMMGLTAELDARHPHSVFEELKSLFARLRLCLLRHDMSPRDLVTLQVFCTDLSLREHLEVILLEFLDGHRPARSVVEVKRLEGGARFEIQALSIAGQNPLLGKAS